MPGVYAMWVPGSAGVPYYGTLVSAFAGGGQYWVDPGYARLGVGGGLGVNIPTPVLVDSRRMRLAKVIILYNGREETVLKTVSVYDGSRLLFERDEWPRGNYSEGLFPENVIDLRTRPKFDSASRCSSGLIRRPGAAPLPSRDSARTFSIPPSPSETEAGPAITAA